MPSFLPKLTGSAFTLDITIAVIFLSIITFFLVKNKKNVKFERMLFPIFYGFLYRGKFGISWMEKLVKKHREKIKIFGYSSIGFGFVGMFIAVLLMLFVAYRLVFVPKSASVAPFLPFMNVPVLGYISFSHWIITLFVVVFFHEAAHGIVALAHNLKIKHTGTGLFAIFLPFIPAAFVEPDENSLKKKPDYVQYSIFAAGPMANFVLLIPLILISLLLINPIESAITETDGFTFDVIQDPSLPAYQANITSGAVFNSFNGEIMSGTDVFRELYWSKPGQIVQLAYVDQDTNTVKDSYIITTTKHPDVEGAGFIGVSSLRNNTYVKDSAKGFAPFFSWLKGLILLLTEITLSLGIINLFPASITDGGRMFSLALQNISKNKELNAKIIAAFAIFFMGIFLFAFLTYFIGNPFSYLF